MPSSVRGWHLDHKPEALQVGPGGQGHALHFGHWWNHPGVFYSVRGGHIRNGMVVVEYYLADQPEGQGGFACIPGSHKSNFRRPDPVSQYLTDTDLVRNPGVEAGDALVFTEALTHGALPWRNGHVRRIVIHRYAAKTIQYGPGFHTAVMQDWVRELPDDQRAALEPAHFYDRDEISDDGVTRSWDDYDRPDYPYED